jgi:Holliday junction resolvase RusA-like endonuclease
MASISFVVPGKPVPKARPRLGRGGFAYTPAKTQVYEALVARTAGKAMREAGLSVFDKQCIVDIEFVFAVPKSWAKAKRLAALNGELWHEGRGDIDNLAKAIFDGMNKVAYLDDRQVVKSSLAKFYGEAHEVKITIRELSRWQRSIKTKNGPQIPWSAGLLTPSYHTPGIPGLTLPSR